MSEPKIIRDFGLTKTGHPTTVYVSEFNDGLFGVYISTTREGMEPVTTTMRLEPKTLDLLSEALSRAAHDPTVWQPILPDEHSDVDNARG